MTSVASEVARELYRFAFRVARMAKDPDDDDAAVEAAAHAFRQPKFYEVPSWDALMRVAAYEREQYARVLGAQRQRKAWASVPGAMATRDTVGFVTGYEPISMGPPPRGGPYHKLLHRDAIERARSARHGPRLP